jgi:hypothetical protein
MPALPWKEFQAVDPGRQYAAMASRLPLRAHRNVPPISGSDLPLDWDEVRRRLATRKGHEKRALISNGPVVPALRRRAAPLE